MEWEAYDQIEPIGPHRDDWHAASICATIMNAMAMQVRSRKRFSVKDFLLQFADDPKDAPKDTKGGPQQPWHKMKFIAQMYVAQANAEVVDKRKKRRT